MKITFKKALSLILALALFMSCAFILASCGNKKTDIKIGVLREDDTSGEATAWESYLKTVGAEMGITFDFTTTNSSASEVAAINTYASKGYDAIFLFSDDDIIASVNAAAAKKLYVVCPTGHPTAEQYEQLKGIEYFLGSVAPTDDTEYEAGYAMAKYFVETKGQTAFTIFGGATCYGASMHIQRLAGMLAYLCEDSGTSYDGAKTRGELVGKVAGSGVDPTKFVSTKYRITGYMDGFAFDDAFSTKLTNSLEAGGTCILSVGAGDTVARIAYGITQSSSKIASVMTGGVDAITDSYASCFDLGYSYDCGKFASAMAPGIVLTVSAINGKKIVDENGLAPRVGMSYWVATSKDALTSMLASDNATDGFCYNKPVLEHFIGNTYAEFLKLCGADYNGAVAIHNEYNK
ncbi:MAG: hypothetical protein ACI4QR_06535 [Eubacteriales bacterium]